MTTASAKLTRRKYGSTQFAVNTLVPNPFDSKPLEDAIRTIGEPRMTELKTKANSRNWTPKRLEAEIRCLADEVQACQED